MKIPMFRYIGQTESRARRSNNPEISSSLCSTFLFFGIFVFVSADQKTLPAEPGQNITLTCQAPKNNIGVVKWSRADLGDEYVLFYRNGQIDPDDQHPSFKNRVDLQDRQMKDGDVSLILNNVTTADNGTYKCGVIEGGSNSLTPICSIYLRVDPPGQSEGDGEDGGDKGGSKEEGEKKYGSVGVIIGLPVLAGLLVAGVSVFLIYRKCNQEQSKDSYQSPAEQQPV